MKLKPSQWQKTDPELDDVLSLDGLAVLVERGQLGRGYSHEEEGDESTHDVCKRVKLHLRDVSF